MPGSIEKKNCTQLPLLYSFLWDPCIFYFILIGKLPIRQCHPTSFFAFFFIPVSFFYLHFSLSSWLFSSLVHPHPYNEEMLQKIHFPFCVCIACAVWRCVHKLIITALFFWRCLCALRIKKFAVCTKTISNSFFTRIFMWFFFRDHSRLLVEMGKGKMNDLSLGSWAREIKKEDMRKKKCIIMKFFG